jgi:hypothetical protein
MANTERISRDEFNMKTQSFRSKSTQRPKYYDNKLYFSKEAPIVFSLFNILKSNITEAKPLNPMRFFKSRSKSTNGELKQNISYKEFPAKKVFKRSRYHLNRNSFMIKRNEVYGPFYSERPN